MPTPLSISFRDIDTSPAIEARIREKAAKLERFFDRALSCKVVVEARHRHKQSGKFYNIRIHLALPGSDIRVGHERRLDHAHEDIYVAIRDAFNALTRQLEDHARRRRGDIKSHAGPTHGRVVRLHNYEGYGFIQGTDGQEVYFHKNSVVGDFDHLQVGDEVRFVAQEGETDKGPQASTVTPIGKHHLSTLEKR